MRQMNYIVPYSTLLHFFFFLYCTYLYRKTLVFVNANVYLCIIYVTFNHIYIHI